MIRSGNAASSGAARPLAKALRQWDVQRLARRQSDEGLSPCRAHHTAIGTVRNTRELPVSAHQSTSGEGRLRPTVIMAGYRG